jgi:hypothetical protein
VERSIFACEVCVPMRHGSDLRAQLRAILQGAPAGCSLQKKWEMYQRLVQVLQPHARTFKKGCWDFFDDDARARRDFEMWTQGMTTREGARDAPADEPGPRYLTLTMAFQIVQGTPTEQRLRKLCDIPEPELWTAHTFARILQGIPSINFASVIGDVAYVIPGTDDDYGLTEEDLRLPKFNYLRDVT